MHARMHWINAVLLATLFVGSLLVWPELPERIPGHFGLDGEVTRWEAPSLARWLLVPVFALGVVVLNYGIAAWLPRRPEIFNHPDRDAFLALPPERRRPVVARMQAFLYGVSGPIIVLFGVVQWMRYRTAGGGDATPYVALALVIGAMIGPLALGIWLPPIGREIREQTRRPPD